MNDPWDVKSVRRSGQYLSCMKINGVPLLPPVLSKECRKEMQYYKLLAKEVEKRISMLQPYVSDSETEISDDKTDAPELPENEENYEITKEDIQPVFNPDTTVVQKLETEVDKNIFADTKFQTSDVYSSLQSNITVVEANGVSSGYDSSKLVIDLSLNINETNKNILDTNKEIPQRTSPNLDVPERDYERPGKIHEKELLTEFDTVKTSRREQKSRDFDLKGSLSRNPFPNLPMNEDGPSSLSAKSFTGSLNDIHTDSMKDSQITPKLIRQRSYTLLKPGPQLLAHLEVQSLSTGVAISCISMSESLSNLSTPNKKRRSWDLETAKVKWSSMAMELKQKNLPNKSTTNTVKTTTTKTTAKKSPIVSPPRARSLALEKSRQESLSRSLPKSEPVQRNKKSLSPVRNASTKTSGKDLHHKQANQNVGTPAKPATQNVGTPAKQASQLISESEDPATRVRELYEKIQKQQLLQMATLVEKQKREQMLLQQVFEEQNNLLYKQLKTIVPKSPDDKNQEVERGPVSLSQLINHKSPDQSLYDSSVSSTLTDTNHYISHCDDVLKKSRDITGSMKKPQPNARSQNGNSIQSPRTPLDGSRTRTHSPARNTSRRLNYDTSASSDRDYEPALTDRTNDTMADLNVTFPSDNSGDYPNNNIVMSHLCGHETTVVQTSPTTTVSGIHSRTESTLKSVDRPIHNPARANSRANKPKIVHQPPTAKERSAATKIVAVAKGYLVRRLMRTERVQGIVQTIKDALLCALQLHQDREGIRGADVDLHRRLIQQITAACYTLHDTFVTSTPAERCAMIAADRGRRRSLAARQTPKPFRQTDLMSQSHTGAFPPRNKRPTSASLMTQSNYETFSGKYSTSRSRYMPSPRRRPWR
ncbi:hypothetical protein O3G_MSEX009338 [Manduca sexta]|uniref:Centriolar coiled-coil protein of 110 kDa n=1 Tax=Manduca sexta TaxID=7130 RepID=A0A921ZF29_MANSE|nr:hypothetical protein O3G_MSEX009338 [Manduca sexta]